MSNTLRNCIIPELGYTFLALDASQIELRVLAILSQDPQLLEDLRTGDLHLATAVRMYGTGILEDEELKKKRRYDAKQGNFALVYGADAYKLSEMLSCSIAEAEEFMAEHKRTYPVLYAWMEATKKQAIEDGFVKNMFGRIRPLPELYAGSFKIREKALREVCNTLVQGTAIDVIKLAMLYMRNILDRRIRLVLNVHDEMLWEVPDELLPEVVEASKELVLAFPNYPFTLVVGKSYGDMKEIL